MQLYIVRVIGVLDWDARSPYIELRNAGTIHSDLQYAKTALSIALMREARLQSDGMAEFNIIWDCPTSARCVTRSFDLNGNKGEWVEAAIGKISPVTI